MRALLAIALVAGCSSSEPHHCAVDPSQIVSSGSGVPHGYVINTLAVPQQRSDFAIDLNCDGRTDNQLGSIVSFLAAGNFDVQTSVNIGIENGSVVTLLSLLTDDLASSDQVGVTLLGGDPTVGMPDFSSAKGHFTVDDAVPPGEFFGRIAEQKFRSNPIGATPPVALSLRLSPTDAIIALPLIGAQIQFETGTDSASAMPGLINGQIHGAVRADDFTRATLPAFAATFTRLIQDDPLNHPNLVADDIGGCSDEGVPASPHDSILTPCELAQDQWVSNVISPDVQIFDSDGRYAPNPDNKFKDSVSIGLGFTAVQADF